MTDRSTGCGRERRGSMTNFNHVGDGCGSICPPGTERVTVSPVSLSNLEVGETVDFEVKFDPNCTNSNMTAELLLTVNIDNTAQ